ncbi:MAG TPA: glycosyltransferase family 2 protein [Longimicrobiales bacterium]|nr:glycosyltransferase family 2 protein [Longimicrobiales bacterium]
MRTLDLGVVILNWNGADDTLACLESVYAAERIPAHVVLVDNGSADDSVARIVAWLESRPGFRRCSGTPSAGLTRWEVHPPAGAAPPERAARFTLVEAGENLGFARGNNVGLRHLLAEGWSHVALLNNDAVVGPDAFAVLLEAMEEHPAAQAVVPQIRYVDPPDRIWSCGGEWTWFGSTWYHYGDRPAAEVRSREPFPVGFVTGCALVLRAAWLRAHGLLTERFFFGEEDVELSWRLRSEGRGTMLCVPAAVAHHRVGASTRRLADGSNAPRTHLQYLNRLVFLRSVWGRGPRWQLRRWVTAGYWGWLLLTRFGASLVESVRKARELAGEAARCDEVGAAQVRRIMGERRP